MVGSCLNTPNSLMAFREAFLKAIFGVEDWRMHDFLLIGWWWDNRVVFQETWSSAFWSHPVWGSRYLSSGYSYYPSPGQGRYKFLMRNSKICVSVIYIPWGGTMILFYHWTIIFLFNWLFLGFCIPSLP